jgi:hypothetical protein
VAIQVLKQLAFPNVACTTALPLQNYRAFDHLDIRSQFHMPRDVTPASPASIPAILFTRPFFSKPRRAFTGTTRQAQMKDGAEGRERDRTL